MSRRDNMVRAAKTRALITAAITNQGPLSREELFSIGTEFEDLRNFKIFISKQIAAGYLAPSDEDPTKLVLGSGKVASVTKKRVSPYEKVTMYRSEDGELFESIDDLKTHIKKRSFMTVVDIHPLYCDEDVRVDSEDLTDWIIRHRDQVLELLSKK